MREMETMRLKGFSLFTIQAVVQLFRPSSAEQANIHQSNINNDHAFSAKHAHKISHRFKKDDRFTGYIGENILDYFDSYDEALRKYNVSIL